MKDGTYSKMAFDSDDKYLVKYTDDYAQLDKPKQNIIVFGGDGFCGWPTSLFLSRYYNVIIVDNFSRRAIDKELGTSSLTPISDINIRINTWEKFTGIKIELVKLDISQRYETLRGLLEVKKPIAIVHFAEQRSAPFSMKSSTTKRYTVNNNINATHNILCAITELGLDTHVVHLGSTGVYGYGVVDGLEIPEGYLKIKVQIDGEDREIEIMHPAFPGSVYHTTKTMDALLFYYYNKNDKIRITDLHQGIIWGTNTEETLMDEKLINRFDYCGDFGTACNRFVMQAALKCPLTVYGAGGQTRAFIHIKDMVRCIKIAIENPPKRGDRVQIFNQMTETHNIKQLAERVSEMTGAEIRYYQNPRNELESNVLVVCNDKFLLLGLNPTTLNDGLLDEIYQIADKYKDRCDKSKIFSDSLWSKDKMVDRIGTL